VRRPRAFWVALLNPPYSCNVSAYGTNPPYLCRFKDVALLGLVFSRLVLMGGKSRKSEALHSYALTRAVVLLASVDALGLKVSSITDVGRARSSAKRAPARPPAQLGGGGGEHGQGEAGRHGAPVSLAEAGSRMLPTVVCAAAADQREYWRQAILKAAPEIPAVCSPCAACYLQ
jgi:hypothetical protein